MIVAVALQELIEYSDGSSGISAGAVPVLYFNAETRGKASKAV